MRRLLLMAAVVASLGGCSVDTSPDRVIPYKCDPDSALGDTQCAGGWRCAVDGVCRDPAVGAPTPCSSSADCLGSWYCGATGTCYDRTLAGAIPCRPGQEDCNEGWRCPSTGVCQQIGVFATYPCLTRADCEAGGHCGAVGRCYQRDTAGDIPCRREVDLDPVERDCAPGWVCSANSRCVDAQDYTLLPNGPVDQLTLTPFSTRGGAAPVDLVATELITSAETAVATVRGSSLELQRIPTGTLVPEPIVVPLSSAPTALALTVVPGTQRVLVVVALETEVRQFDWSPGGAPVATEVTVPFLPDRLYTSSASRWFMGEGQGRVWLLPFGDTVALGPSDLPASSDGGTLETRQLNVVGLAGSYWLTAVTGEGLYASRTRSDGQFLLTDGGVQTLPDWTPVRVPGVSHVACPGDDGGMGELLSVVSGTGGSTGSGTYRELRLAYLPGEGPLADRPASYTVAGRVDVTPMSCERMVFGSIPGSPCAVCPEGATLEHLHGRARVAVCRQALPDGGFESRTYSQVSSACAEPTPWGNALATASVLAASSSSENSHAYGTADGNVVLGPMGALEEVPLLLASAPRGLGHSSDGTPLALSGPFVYQRQGDGYSLREIRNPVFCGAVKDAEERLIRRGPVADVTYRGVGSPLEDSFGISTACDSPPLLGTAVSLRDGGTGLALVGKDRVWAQEVGADGGVPSLPVRIAPFAYSSFSSLAALQPSAKTAGWGSLYGIVSQRLVSLEAPSLARWTSTELTAPAGELLQVWADQDRGRLTFRDGVTYSLPLLAPLAGPLPAGDPAALEVVEVCGAAYALGESDLYRLEGDGSWNPLGVGTLLGGPLRGGRLHPLGAALHLFLPDGRGVEINDTACLR